MRILIIEDEKALSDALTEILKQNHYAVDSVHHGSKGLDYARSGIYDLILLDIMLPGMDGLSILKTLRREHITTPVILLTAKSEISDIIAGLDAGSDDHLPSLSPQASCLPESAPFPGAVRPITKKFFPAGIYPSTRAPWSLAAAVVL